MRPVLSFHVRPRMPERLKALEDLAYNLRWSWDHETIALFRRLDRDLWETTGHNPVSMLGLVSQERLREAVDDEAFVAHLDRTAEGLRRYLSGEGTWGRKRFGADSGTLVAYFSMEFGLTECLPIYSGGLGILAADHLKSASDLGLPLVGVGLLYQKGYFRQYLNPEGWQQERYPVNDFYNLPVRPVEAEGGGPLCVEVDLDGRRTRIQVWRALVGRVPLLLLDTNLPENPRDLQDITDELYGGDTDMRICQEIVLGIGGMRALDAAGYLARAYHMNEGHSAFAGLERIRILMKRDGLTLGEALEVVRASTVFTTHTPVPAGIDEFPPERVERHLGRFRLELGLEREGFADLGRVRGGDPTLPFNMAILAIRTSGFVNGVSRLHGHVSRAMWREVWPGVPEDEIPIRYVTNGVHPGSWISEEMRYLYDRYLGPRWAEEPGDTRVWRRSEQIPGEELWRAHERRRERMTAFIRRRLTDQLRNRGAGKAEIAQAEEVLDPEALTVGFARRFATYKRATLVLRDPERLERLLNAPGRPVQIVFAGKAHPRDEAGKGLIREIIRLARRPELRRRMVFLEDYDQSIARYLVQGVDVWLNTPRRPLEASGTSGMKASFNGALNLSVPDGWWDEAYHPALGWSIGRGEEYRDLDYQDRVEAGALYDLLEKEVVPLFYDRGTDGVPRGWVERMKAALSAICPVFHTNRMVHQYAVEAYCPARDRRGRLEADAFRRARSLAAWRSKVWAGWPRVRVEKVEADVPSDPGVGDAFEVRAWANLGALGPDDVAVEVYRGRVDENQEILGGEAIAMQPDGGGEAGPVLFRTRVPWTTSGRLGLTVRIVPRHEDLAGPFDPGLVTWAS